MEGMAVAWRPARVPAPRLLKLNRGLAEELGLDADALASEAGLAVLSGNDVPEGAQPIAQAYAGHQFGGFSPQLGDGRALLLGEVIDTLRPAARHRLQGLRAARRFRAVATARRPLGPVLREYLISEAMHALGIPTTRTLAAVATGEAVYRERPLPGALLTRVAASHIRVGTFQFFAARQDTERLTRLADHVIARHDPVAAGQQEDRYLALLRAVLERQAVLLARWMGVGFIHGVMNTDNMTVSGETIDYGPCAFMEAFDPDDGVQLHRHPRPLRLRQAAGHRAVEPDPAGRGAAAADRHRRRPGRRRARWRCSTAFPDRFSHHWLAGMRGKLGLPAGGRRRSRPRPRQRPPRA